MIDIFQRDLVNCLEFGLVSRGSVRMCVRALTVGTLEMHVTIWCGFCQLLLLLWLYHSWSSCLVSYINVHVYVKCPHEFSGLYNHTSGRDRNTPGEHTKLWSFPRLFRIQRIFYSCCQSLCYSSAFSFHQAPITAGWIEAAWSEKFTRHFYTWPAVRIAPETFWSLVQFHIH